MTIFVRTMLIALAVGAMSAERVTIAQTSAQAELMTSTEVYFSDAHSITTKRFLSSAARSGLSHDEIYTSDEIYGTDALCTRNADYRSNPGGPAYGWLVNVTRLTETRETVVVRVDWQRSRDRGKTTDGAQTSLELRLVSRGSVPLDFMLAGPAPQGAACQVVGVLLRIELTPIGPPDTRQP